MVGAPIVVNPSEAWDGNDGPWSTFALGFGTPPQFVRVLISTTCPQPWAVDPLGCTATDPANCASDRAGLFNKNHSSTWQDQGLYELDQELNLGYTGNGNFGLDSIALGYPGSGAITIEHQLLATIATKDFYIATWGIAPRPTNLTRADPREVVFSSEDSHQSLLSTLKEQERIPSLSYGYTAGARYRLKRVPASLTLGGVDASRFVTSNLTFKLAGDNSRDLVVGLQKISVVESSLELLSSPILTFIDATVPHIWLSLEACKFFEEAFGIRWDSASGLYLVNETTHQALLAQNASLSFIIGSDTMTPDVVNITLPYASFDLQVLDTYPNVKNSTRYFPLRRATNDTQYTLGRAFLQETYLIADYERSSFSINQCRFAENISSDIRPIFSPNTTNKTNGTGNSDPHNQNTSGLTPGIIAAIVVSSTIFLVILVLSIIVIRRRKRQGEAPNAVQFEQKAMVPDVVDVECEHELHGEPIPPSELHGVSNGPLEMEDGVAAVEKDAATRERYELYG